MRDFHSISKAPRRMHAILRPTLKVFSAVSFAVICPIASSAPNISETEYDSSQNSLLIRGSDFGNNLQFALLDTVDQTEFSVMNGKPINFEYEGLWGNYGTQWAEPLIEKRMDSSLSKDENELYYGGPGRANNSWLRPLSEINAKSLYVSWLYKPMKDPAAEGGSNKFIRIWDDKSGNNTRISWTQMHLTYVAKDVPGSDGVSWGGWPGKVNSWNHHEIYVDSQDGTVKAWTNGELVHDVSDFVKSPTQTGLNVRLLGFDPSIGDPYSDMEILIDNLYVSSSPAKVFISDQVSWDKTTAVASQVQLPIDWSENYIRIKFDSKSISQGNYLYVMNEDFEVNSQGYPLCLKCPERPTLTID